MRKKVYRGLLSGLVLAIVASMVVFAMPVAQPVYATTDEFIATTADGYMHNDYTGYTYCHDDTTSDDVDTASTTLYLGQTTGYEIWRTGLFFDTSSIPDDATITSATLKLFGTGDYSSTNFYIVVQEGDFGGSLTTSDYNEANFSGNGGELSTAYFVMSDYNEIELNSTGLTWINKTGTTELGVRSKEDINSSAPTQNEYVTFRSADTGTSLKPILEVTYTVITAPDVNTDAASNVAQTTARLNSTVVDDGGDDCEIRWGWDDDSHPAATAATDYENYTTFAGAYNTGEHPYYDASSLSPTTTYYFRVEIQNSDSSELGSELNFTTETVVNDPTDFRAYPSATSVSLAWTKSTGMTESVVRYRYDTFPTTYTDGYEVYEGTSASYTHTGLTRGTTIYYAVWGKSGATYSSGSAEVMVTTLAAETGGDELEAPSTPLRWLTATDYTNMSGLGPLYDGWNAVADSMSIPRNTHWFLCFLFAGMFIAAIVYFWTAGSIMPTLITLEVFYALGWALQQLPLVIPALLAIILSAFFFVRKREAV